MRTLISTFFDILLHRRGPEDLPASRFLFGIVLGCYVVAAVLSLLMARPLANALGIVVLSVSLLCVFLCVLLWLAGKPRRFLQAATAYVGVDTILTVFGLPLMWWISIGQGINPDAPPPLPALLYLGLVIWSLEVFSYILSRTLEVAYWVAAALVAFYFAFGLLVDQLIFQSQPATG